MSAKDTLRAFAILGFLVVGLFLLAPVFIHGYHIKDVGLFLWVTIPALLLVLWSLYENLMREPYAAVSTSSGGENDAAVVAAVESPVASVSARGNPPQTEPSKAAPAATPPLSADLAGAINAAPNSDALARDICASLNNALVRRIRESLSADPRNPLSADAVADAYGLNEYETVTVRRDDLEWALDWIDPDDHDVCQRRQRLMDVLR